MKVLAIAINNVRRMLRERSNIFFVFIFPIALILLIGAQFGGGVDPIVGVAGPDSVSSAVIDRLDDTAGVDAARYGDPEELAAAVERGQIQGGLASLDDTGTRFEFLSRPDGMGAQLRSVVEVALARETMVEAAAQFAASNGIEIEDARAVAGELAAGSASLTVATKTVGEALFPATLGQFDLGASQQLVLFVFLTALAGSANIILSRQLGLTRRMLSTPTSAGTVVTGEGAGRWAVAMVQGLYIMIATFLIFRVNWGDPVAALILVAAFSAVGAGAGMLMGALFRNEQQAGGIAIVLSLGLAALGGSMLPSELFSPTMKTVAHLTPHAWALDGFAELVRRDGTLWDILPEIGVLVAYATVLMLVAAWRLRNVITKE